MATTTVEASREGTLRAVSKLGGAPEEEFDILVRMLARQLPGASVWLAVLDQHQRPHLKAQVGLAEPKLPLLATELALTLSLDDTALQQGIDPSGNGWAACRVVAQQHAVGILGLTHPGSSLDNSTLAALRETATLAGAMLDSRLKESLWRYHAERVREASLSSTDWLWESDDQGRVRWVSSGVQAHTGMPPNLVIGRTLQQINEPVEDDATRSWERYRDARSRQAPFRDVLAHRPSPSGRITVSISGTPVFDETGTFRGYRGTTSNVTERIEAQRAAQAAERLLSEAMDSLTAGVMISDPQGRVVVANAVWRRSLAAYMHGDPSWPEIVQRMADAGDYPAAQGRDDFVRWRLSLASPRGEQHEMRWKGRWVIVSDRRLNDGSVVHLSIDISDRKEAELALARQQEQLRESQDQLSAVLGAVPDLWLVLDDEGRYLACSSDKHPMLVHSWDSVRGLPFDSGVPRPIADLALPAIRQALATGEVQRIQYDLTTRDGVMRTFEARISPMPNKRVLYVTRDLTELRNLERDVLIMQRAFEAEASLSMCVSDALQPDMPLIYVNPAFERLTGYSRAEALGQNCRFLQGHLRDEPGCSTLREAIDQGRSASVTVRNVRKDGSVFSNAVHVAPVRDANGQLTHYIGVQRDVTEQTRAADKLRLSEELYRSVALAISDGLLVVTPTLGILAVNPAGCDIVGAEQTALMNAPGDAWPFELLGPDAAPLASDQHPVLRVIANDQPLVNQIHALRRADGEQRWVALNAHPLQLRPEAQTFAVVLTFRDITQQRRSEQALRDKQAAELASHAKSEFLSRMSHEMRTPLNAVIGFAQLLNLSPSGLDGATVRDYAGHVLEAGEHLLALIDDVLDLQKIEEGALTLKLNPVDLHQAVTRASELLMPLAQAAGVRFELSVPPATWVQADMQRLRQVLLNVGSNAIKYNHPGGIVRWRLDALPDRVALCIEDTGSGMTDEQMSRLFQPFERLGRETSTIEGTGLGLIIARSLTQAIGGRLSIVSRAGLGTSVRLDLQPADAPAAMPAKTETLATPTQVRPLRMLYVEDNRINAILFEEAMRLHGDRIELRVAEDGDQALSIAQEWPPEMLVLDAHLPGASGFEVLHLLRALPGLDNVPAYMCSADAMPDDVQRAYEAGFIGYWTKPIHVGTILADVEQCLQRSHGGA
ncbi:PAS domain S-box protein [Piscinibacter gummiphilus]|uniref:histidine kinase n=1 Tax=Piscinibacter gummiphilus TaxID=946333 RepID=A0ABZ0D0N1_9BURK|nr:PAS domain S-box protein [Piscinibacter gummiphilus]WOB10727.1 PAS domain S-box protein [Piscinibacter gummiphilus]